MSSLRLTVRRAVRPLALALAAGSLPQLAGCVVAPVAPVAPGPYVVPPGVAYVAPAYPMPSVGFVWQYHPRYGWGWHHPVYGWHRGWR
ncbi:hypothetical protein CTI10_015205 [Delftia acidovorans]|nr:hypothetical protein CTI10_015205 [Delftia acidovorans]